ncbi:hypothetical protein NSMM_520013 [Nitrosomonas mobilis]|uniref:Uncharacterized protein n=2 Tax=Nitrosomonas mobilis TaxID=51642 RepID=A0A1G5SGL8_9PROT|nr:hypothetical protein NSMM_520013 [Nitrosomonas mobilis]
MTCQPLPHHVIKESNMSMNQKCGLQALARRLLAGLLAICSPVVIAQTSVVTRSDNIGERNKSYRNIGNIELSSFSSEPATLPVDTCAIVDHIEQINMANEINSSTDTRIMGTIAQSAGRNADKVFYANVDVPAGQGYHPPQRNIEKTDHFRIYLATFDGNLHIVTQPASPRFMPGDTVLLRDSGLLEATDCTHKPVSR